MNVRMRNIRHIGIYVENLEKMKEFYCRNFNMNVIANEKECGEYINTILGTEEIEIELYKLVCQDGSLLELIKVNHNMNRRAPEKITEIGSKHIAFTVENIDDKYKILLEQGIHFLSLPHISSTQVAKVCFCQDPEGNYLELVEEINA